MENPLKPFLCDFCGHGFKRSDALRRHSGTCKVRREAQSQVQYVPKKIRGKKPRACDRCARLRRACTSTRPCKLCAARRLPCTYHRMRRSDDEEVVQQKQDERHFTPLDSYHIEEPTEIIAPSASEVPTDLSSLECGNIRVKQAQLRDMSSVSNLNLWSDPDVPSTWQFLDASLAPGLLFPRPTDFNLEALKTFPFFTKLTIVHGLGNTFECGDLHQRSIIAGGFSLASMMCVEDLAIAQSDALWTDPLPDFSDLPTLDCTTLVSTELLNKSKEIIATLLRKDARDVSRREYANSCSLSSETACYRLFSADRIHRYLSLYWSCWHPNWPVMHKSSFSVSKTSPALVAAMAVIGACLSTTQEDCTLARLVFDTLEDVVFSDEVFLDYRLPVPREDCSEIDLRHQLQILLAAYCVCLYQTWEGSRIAKKRARRRRYNQIIGLARDIGFESATLRGIDTTHFAAFDWEEFALRESLNRTFAYITNLDTGYAMFYQAPVRMSVHELSFDLSTPEACFAAGSAQDCFASLKGWRDTLRPHKTVSVSFAVTMLCSTKCPAEVERMVSRLSVLSMFTLISTLYKLANQVENSLLYSVLSPALQHGLYHWVRLWPSEYRDYELLDTFADPTGLQVQSIGFQRYAPEYWLYTYFTIQRARRVSNWGHGLQDESIAYDDNDMNRHRRLLREFRANGTGEP